MKVPTHFWASCDLKDTKLYLFDRAFLSLNGGTDEALPTIELRFQHREQGSGSLSCRLFVRPHDGRAKAVVVTQKLELRAEA
jgi:hypothetical protein